ncbi:MAG: phosphodiester glycosidase family protein [Sphingobacteriaceae bacterium]
MKNRLLLNVLLLLVSLSASAQYTLNSTRRMSPGVRYKEYSTSSPARKIFVMEIDLEEPTVRLQVVKASGVINGAPQTTSAMFDDNDNFNRHDVSAGVNADFFTSNLTYKNPRHMLISDGEILWDTIRAPSVFAISEDNEPFIGTLSENYTVTANGVNQSFNQINRSRGTNQLVLYNRFKGASTGTNSSGTEVKIVPVDGVGAWKANGVIQVKVLAKQSGVGNMSFASGEAVLSGHGTSKTFLDNNFNVNDVVTLNLNVIASGISNIKQLTGGLPRIVLNGTNYAAQGIINEGNALGTERHPRTAIGYTQDKSKIFMAVVDGRTTISAGMTFSEMADFMIYLGCYQSLNLDGGGSSTMVGNGDLKNAPSDGSERLVGSSILAYLNSLTLDDFEAGVGHFNRAPTYSSTTVGVATTSTAIISTTAHSGNQSLIVKLYDNTSSSAAWKVRLLSGSGIPTNNRYFPGTGTLSFWAKTSTAASGAKLRIWLDDNDGTEISPSLDVINDGQWHKYTWNLANYNGTSPDTGNGVINSTGTRLDAIEFSQPNTSATWFIYIDDLYHDINSTAATGSQLIANTIASVSALPDNISENTLQDFNAAHNTIIYPNPNNGRFEIEFKDEHTENFEMIVSTLDGRQIFTNNYKAGKHTIDLPGVNDGMYLVTVRSGNKNQTFKMMISK